MICVPSKPSTILLPGCAYARIMKPVPAKCCGAAPVVARIGFGKPCAWRPPLYTTRKAIWATNTGAYAPDWERQKPLPPWRTNWPESFGLSLPAKSHLIRVSLLTMKRLMSSAGSSVFRLQPGKWAINSPQSPHENQASLAQPSWVIPPCSSLGLPTDVSYTIAYDRSALVYRADATLEEKLIEESVVVALVCILFLLHFRSALVA